ncbi:MAG: signal peptide peptidase SppA [Gemmataceae bacterium]|nr:signal peptide peptidase SppA [Gemmataceae bacterium]
MGRWLALLATLPMTGCFNGILLTPTHVSDPVEETTVTCAKRWRCKDKVALIDVDGMILNARSSGLLGSGDNPVSLFRERLEAAANDKRVKAVVLRLNSPGGAVTASDIMYNDLLSFRRNTGKPVVACMMDVAASGAYYLAMACDSVYAHPTTVTGSIGVIMNLYNAAGLATKIGISSNPIKSGPIKDLGNPLRDMTDAERAVLQGMVDNFYAQFVQVVAQGRRMREDQVRHLADGRVYTGVQAKEFGLVDEVGYLEDAVSEAMARAGVEDATVVAYDRGAGHRGSVYAGLNIPSTINIKLDVPFVSRAGGAAFLFLWEAGAPQ